MNSKDREILTSEYLYAERSVSSAFENTVIAMQDAAYNTGLERGKMNINKTLIALEKAMDSIESGDGKALQILNELHEELSC